jgi:uncharacterized surface protein with fasciclin (FAS1) repeats
MMSAADDTREKDIVVNAANAGNFATLTNALKAADLVTTYKGIGPFTFFAPTDAAFAKLHESCSIQGEPLRFAANDSGFTVNGAPVSKQEIEASNGVIHAIDTVMMPKPM